MTLIQGSMKQISSRNVSYQIDLMEWSTKMDLVAIASKGEVIINRFKWQKVWSYPAADETLRVRAIAWRNDEKMLAIGYSNGLVQLLEIENHEEIYSIRLDGDINCMTWTNNSREVITEEDNLDGTAYLASLPSLNALSSSARKHDYNSLKYYSKNVPNLLLIGYKPGRVKLLIFGVLPCGVLDLSNNIIDEGDLTVKDIKMSSDLREIFVLVQSDVAIRLLVYENPTLAKYSSSLLKIATQHGHILNTISYITDTIQCITESWEQVLLEMDNKLSKFAETMPPGESLAADFLELLLFGYPSSPALLEFLTKELTEKGLKKLGNSIDLSYSTIQKLVVKPLTCGIINILYHLSVVKGMYRNQFYYGSLLDESAEKAFIAAGAFFIKSKELQQTIETSTRDYKIFFRWLYYVIVRLQEENVPSDIASVRQQEINYLAEFIKNLDDINEKVEEDSAVGTEKRKFNLERVGQYLHDRELAFQTKEDFNKAWQGLVEENLCLANNPNILPHHRKLSLVQEFNQMKESIDVAFLRPNDTMTKEFKLRASFKNLLIDSNRLSLVATQTVVESDNATISAIIESESSVLFLESKPQTPIRSIRLVLDQTIPLTGYPLLTFRHIQFYNDSILSMLLRTSTGSVGTNKCNSYFIQYPVVRLREECSEHVAANGGPTVQINCYQTIDETMLKPLEGIEGLAIGVSGPRKVSSLLSESKKIIRIYEMEVDDEDDEPLEISSQNVSMENTSMENTSMEN